MTTFNTVDELLDILDKDPRLLEAVRIKILTEELIKLPHDFAEFKETTNTRFDGIDTQLNEHGKRLDGIDTRLDGIDTRLDEHGRRLDGIGGNVSDLKGHHTIQDARTNAAFIAGEMELEWIRTLEQVDVLRIWQAAERDRLTGGISRNDRRSFLHSDIVIDALDSQGNECFIAVEVSYTVQARDIERAIRNASYLARFTGKPSYMAVTGVSKLEEVNDTISEENPQAFDDTRGSIVFWLERQDIGSPD
ncbi:MAG: hypothetical protein OXD31_18470 [Chloroflexi bacterium]|nr:hypothetical protein [Chloroflexota bacterium]